MYDDPTPTSPSQIITIASDDYKFRVHVINELAAARAWRDYHTADDERRFLEIDRRMNGVTSSVNDYDDTKSQVMGAKRLALGIVALVAGIGGCIIFAIEIIKAFK